MQPASDASDHGFAFCERNITRNARLSAGNLAGGEVSLTRNLASKETFETNFGAKELKQRKNSFGKNKIVNSRTHEKKLFEQTKITICNYI